MMTKPKALIIGANGFIGRYVTKRLSTDYDVIQVSSLSLKLPHQLTMNLLDQASIDTVLSSVKPDFIVNCAGIIENNENAYRNIDMTRNLLKSVADTKSTVKKIIILGSSAEYGECRLEDLPIKETKSLQPKSDYGVSKKMEIEQALEYSQAHDLPIIVLRIFNPLGVGMNKRFLVPNIKEQIKQFQSGTIDAIKVSRLDACRDYVSAYDISDAIKVALESKPYNVVYNVGSGTSTTNKELLESILKCYNISDEIHIVETSDTKEPLMAVQADISKIKAELHWHPTHLLDDIVKEIVDEQES